MSEEVKSCRVIVQNREGIHARPAHLLAKLASGFQAEIQIVRNSESVDGKSILSILTLAAEHGTELSIRAKGPDAEAAVKALAELFEKGFPMPGSEGPSATDHEHQPPATWAENGVGLDPERG